MGMEFEYQYYILENTKTRREVEIKLLQPVLLKNANKRIGDALRDKGFEYDESWNIKQAWLGK